MNYYEQQITMIRKKFIPKEYLCKQVITGKHFIDTNFTRKISLSEVARYACISKYHFLRLFKLIYGTTPHQYLTVKRLEAAKQLLRSGNTVSDVCFHVGFESISSFKGLFKSYTDHSPSYYQKSNI